MGHLGPAALAAHNAVYQQVYIVFQVAIGLSQGASILVSKAIAIGDLGHAHRLVRTTLGRSAAFVAVVGIVYVAIPNQVLRLFLDRPLPQAKTLLLIAVGLQFVDAAQNIAVGLLRGLGDTAAAFRLSVIGYWLVGLPTALVLAFPAGLGAVGVWFGLTAGLAASATLMLRRYYADLPNLRR
jgi:MATE family multidrug resistance protein